MEREKGALLENGFTSIKTHEQKLTCPPSHPSFTNAGAEFDKLVDKEGVEEMAAFADAGAPVFLPLAHDVMLGPDWPIAAEALLEWVEGLENRKKVSRK